MRTSYRLLAASSSPQAVGATAMDNGFSVGIAEVVGMAHAIPDTSLCHTMPPKEPDNLRGFCIGVSFFTSVH